MVKLCQIENAIVKDVWCTLAYPVMALARGWPQRGPLLREMMHLDMDRDGKNDEEQAEVIPITPQSLHEFWLASSRECADSLIEHYSWVCPAMAIGHVAQDHGLDHHRLQGRLYTIDEIVYKSDRRRRQVSPLFGEGGGAGGQGSQKPVEAHAVLPVAARKGPALPLLAGPTSGELAGATALLQLAREERIAAELALRQAKAEREAADQAIQVLRQACEDLERSTTQLPESSHDVTFV